MLRRVWARRGPRLSAPVRPRYQWCFVSDCVRLTTGHTRSQRNSSPFVRKLIQFSTPLHLYEAALTGLQGEFVTVIDTPTEVATASGTAAARATH